MSSCVTCTSTEIHPGIRGRDFTRPDLCDACFWRERAYAAEMRLEAIDRRTQRHSHAKSLGAAVEGDAVIMTRLRAEREQADRSLAAVRETLVVVANPGFLTDELVDQAVQAWNDTPIGHHGHLISNRFERKQLLSALAVVGPTIVAAVQQAISLPTKPMTPS